MLSTLTKIGLQLLEGKGIWAQLTTEPKTTEGKAHWICPILFDCKNEKIEILYNQMVRFNEDAPVDFRYVSPSLWGPRGKKCALTVEPKNFGMLEETLFGKELGNEGSMSRSMAEFPEYKDTPLREALLEINHKLNGQKSSLDLGKIKASGNLGIQDEIVLYSAEVRLSDRKNNESIRLSELYGFDEFIIRKFGTSESGDKGIDYVSGNSVDLAVEANFAGRYNIHKIFQTTAANYASGFSGFKKSFQTSPETVAALDKASQYVLRKLQTRIAGISHIVVPSYLHKDVDGFSVHDTEMFIDRSSDLLFKYDELIRDVELELPNTPIFWLNYFAFESDGNSFKIMNQIKDVNSAYLKKVIQIFNQVGIDFRPYIGGKYAFNLQAVYFIIPVRDGNKSKNNASLNLFKDILEQRAIDTDNMYAHFINLVLCHWYGRYAAFPNIRKNENFDFAIKDAVFKYSALFAALKQLNLINMEKEQNQNLTDSEKPISEFQQRVEDYFNRMDYSENEKSLFYLGRVLSSVARAQYDKGHKNKPVLNKINFNGMDSQGLMRLSLDLAEKARQYSIHKETDWNFARFRENFNEKIWSLTNDQNLFYLLAGYSFGLTDSNKIQTT